MGEQWRTVVGWVWHDWFDWFLIGLGNCIWSFFFFFLCSAPFALPIGVARFEAAAASGARRHCLFPYLQPSDSRISKRGTLVHRKGNQTRGNGARNDLGEDKVETPLCGATGHCQRHLFRATKQCKRVGPSEQTHRHLCARHIVQRRQTGNVQARRASPAFTPSFPATPTVAADQPRDRVLREHVHERHGPRRGGHGRDGRRVNNVQAGDALDAQCRVEHPPDGGPPRVVPRKIRRFPHPTRVKGRVGARRRLDHPKRRRKGAQDPPQVPHARDGRRHIGTRLKQHSVRGRGRKDAAVGQDEAPTRRGVDVARGVKDGRAWWPPERRRGGADVRPAAGREAAEAHERRLREHLVAATFPIAARRCRREQRRVVDTREGHAGVLTADAAKGADRRPLPDRQVDAGHHAGGPHRGGAPNARQQQQLRGSKRARGPKDGRAGAEGARPARRPRRRVEHVHARRA
ncbi:hypothetical protein BU14_0220s0026 [Porphyra umbilicalis]|uniref:Uncharacterized protein n=1 Tax=Porphyra umbilicalis TaxID=2786 RepID=A0A1X6P4W5_PORUM|nr:hypothetical protein BU14_0220s0026 [Porphyra umbilicalis]|eukprot:OSX75795.1 hypothetical protein BU14_0220s0026 [Porphyra umbilicalis]